MEQGIEGGVSYLRYSELRVIESILAYRTVADAYFVCVCVWMCMLSVDCTYLPTKSQLGMLGSHASVNTLIVILGSYCLCMLNWSNLTNWSNLSYKR